LVGGGNLHGRLVGNQGLVGNGLVGNQGLVGYEVVSLGNQVVSDWLNHQVRLLDLDDVCGLHQRGVVDPSGMMVLTNQIDRCFNFSFVVVNRYVIGDRYIVNFRYWVHDRVLLLGELVVHILSEPSSFYWAESRYILVRSDGFLGLLMVVYQGSDEFDRPP